MLTFFRHNTLTAAILTLLLAVLLHIPEFMNPHEYVFIKNAPLASIVFNFIENLGSPYTWALITNTLLVIVQAMLLNYIVSSHEILYKDTYLPGLMFVVLSSIYPIQTELTPQLISNLFVLLLFLRICYLYEHPSPLLLMLDGGFYSGIALLFNYDTVIFLPFILISVIIFTKFNVRYLLISLLGILLPLYIVASIFYLTNQLDELISYVLQSFKTNTLQAIIYRKDYLLPFVLIIPILLLSTLGLQQNFFRNKVKTRRIAQAIILMLLFGVIGLFIENTNFVYALIYLNIPLAILVGYYFISEKRFWIKEILFLAFIGLIVYFRLA